MKNFLIIISIFIPLISTAQDDPCKTKYIKVRICPKDGNTNVVTPFVPVVTGGGGEILKSEERKRVLFSLLALEMSEEQRSALLQIVTDEQRKLITDNLEEFDVETIPVKHNQLIIFENKPNEMNGIKNILEQFQKSIKSSDLKDDNKLLRYIEKSKNRLEKLNQVQIDQSKIISGNG